MYQDLKSFQQAALVYDLTIKFCALYIDKTDRTDKSYKSYSADRMSGQMVQAARSGKQNIAEGTTRSKEKPKSEVYLLSIASASLKELLEDFQDFLRQRNLAAWDKDDERALVVRRLAYRTDKTDKSDGTDRTDKSDGTDRSDVTDKTDKTDKTYKTYESYLQNPETAANMMICLINQDTYLLDQQIRAIKKQMESKGISQETQNQKIRRFMKETKKKDDDFNKELQEFLAGNKKAFDKSDNTDKTY